MSSKRILVVDDDRTVLESLKGILESEGYAVDTAEKGRQALARFESEFYDVVLLDIKLPDIEGTKLLRTLHDRFPETVKIMVTGYPTLTNAVESLNKGADAYLMKPANPRELLRIVKDRLTKREKARNSSREKMKPPSKTKERPPPSTRKENKPLDKMIDKALSLLKDETSQKETANRPRQRKIEIEAKKNVTPEERPKSVAQKPQSPEQNFWFSLANLDLKSTGISKKPKKAVDEAKPE